jgi:hypothetical protein
MEVSCYNFVAITYEQGFLDPSTDATYIIHLEGNGRYDHIMDQLSKYHPTKLVYILYNKGYKKCKKKLPRELPRYDLTDAFVTCFKHATAQNYNNILILEDDFIFTDLILDPIIPNRVNKFINEQNNELFIYLLGSLSTLQLPYDNYHTIVPSGAGAHSIVYSKEFIKYTLKMNISDIHDWDQHTWTSLKRYTYYKPLCVQLFPMTENKKEWGTGFIEGLHKILFLDTHIEPGYTIYNIVSKLLFFYILAFLVYLFLYLTKYFKLTKYNIFLKLLLFCIYIYGFYILYRSL